jgi:hypothetical protein
MVTEIRNNGFLSQLQRKMAKSLNLNSHKISRKQAVEKRMFSYKTLLIGISCLPFQLNIGS